MKRLALLLFGSLLLFGCDDGLVTPPLVPGGPKAAILDGAHNSGNPNFFFLPPMVEDPIAQGVFNPRLVPVVEICEWTDGTCVLPLLAVFTTTSGTDGETISVSTADEHYKVNWHTDRFAIDPNKTYRLRVLTASAARGGTELGHADVVFAENGQALKNLSTGESIALVDGRTLPIRFRIEEGALTGGCQTDCFEGSVGPAGGIFTTQSRHAGVFFPQNAVDEEVNLIIERIDVVTAGGCLPTDLEQAEGCYVFDTEPNLDHFNTEVTVGVCLDASVVDTEPYQLHQFDEDDPAPAVIALTNVEENFLDCAQFVASLDDGPLMSLARAGWNLLARPLERLLGPTPLWAVNLGFGGLAGSFSRFGWAKPLTITIVEGNGQTASTGATLPIAPKVLVREEHHHPDDPPGPIVGAALTFAFTDPAGAITTTTATTGLDGTAAVAWPLSIIAGQHTLVVTAPGATFDAAGNVLSASLDEVTFTATTVAASQPILYSVNSSDDGLSVIDAGTAAVTFVSRLHPDPAVFTTPVAMAIDPGSNQILVWNNSGRAGNSGVGTGDLLSVDACTGLATIVIDSTGIAMTALAAHPTTGELYGGRTTLHRIDPNLDTVTAIGNPGIEVFGLAFAADGTLYGLSSGNSTLPTLVTIDPATAQTLTAVQLSAAVGVTGSIAFDPNGTLIGSGFGGVDGSILFDIDPQSGTVSNIRGIVGGFAPQGMGFAPECSS